MTTATLDTRASAAAAEPAGRRPRTVTAGRVGVYAFLVISALFFLIPLWIMLMTSLKPMDEIRLGNIFALPREPTVEPWITAWSSACTGLECNGISVGFWNSVQILVPSVVLSIAVGAVTGYALSFWRVRGANIMFAFLLIGAFIPYQVFIYPLVRLFAFTGLYNSLICVVIVHVIFGLPLMTLLFRNFYAGIPVELFKAARVDGGGFWSIFLFVILPMSPQLNNIVNSTQGERAYNVDMAATILTALVPLVVYFVSGRWFVRGIAAGAVKG